MLSEITVHIIKPSSITEIYTMSKREACECDYIRENEVCPSRLDIVNA